MLRSPPYATAGFAHASRVRPRARSASSLYLAAWCLVFFGCKGCFDFGDDDDDGCGSSFDDEDGGGGFSDGGGGFGQGGFIDGGGGDGGNGDGGGVGGGSPSARCPSGIAPDPDLAQALPAANVDITMPVPMGIPRTVFEGDDLQAALDESLPGDVIELEAGGIFQGPYTLPSFDDGGALIIRSTAHAELPPEGTRVDPTYVDRMPTLLASETNDPALRAAPGAHDIRLIGIHFSTPGYVNALVDLGSGAATIEEMPTNIVFDRTYFQGDEVEGTRRGLALNSAATAVIDSYFEDFKEVGADSQAIGGWAGTGPYLIANNYLEGAGENFILGGADPSISDVVPSDLTFCHNHVAKPLEWLEQDWSVKNLLELKNTRRALIAGNVFENNWLDAQVGFSILFTVRNQDGSAPWSAVEDVTFKYNVIRNVASGVNVLASDDNNTSLPVARVLVAHNLIDRIDTAALGGDGRATQVGYGGGTGQSVKFSHNTVTTADNAFFTFGDSAPVLDELFFTDSIVAHGDYGAFGSGQGEGTTALDFYFTSYTFTGNVIFGGTGTYPEGNALVATIDEVGFVDPVAGDWALAPSSAYAGTATDGTDPGADMAALRDATAGVVPGSR